MIFGCNLSREFKLDAHRTLPAFFSVFLRMSISSIYIIWSFCFQLPPSFPSDLPVSSPLPNILVPWGSHICAYFVPFLPPLSMCVRARKKQCVRSYRLKTDYSKVTKRHQMPVHVPAPPDLELNWINVFGPGSVAFFSVILSYSARERHP